MTEEKKDKAVSNINELHEQTLTIGQKAADWLARFAGSWTFIIAFSVAIFIWISMNSVLIFTKHFDPYPFILLNLVLSCLAAIQAPIIMMSQNRLESRDRLRAKNDYNVNVKAEDEIEAIQRKLDMLVESVCKR